MRGIKYPTHPVTVPAKKLLQVRTAVVTRILGVRHQRHGREIIEACLIQKGKSKVSLVYLTLPRRELDFL